jgi:hypothetical protein
MSEQVYNISSLLSFSLFSEDSLEENNDETNNSNEFFKQDSFEYEAFSIDELFNILDDDTDTIWAASIVPIDMDQSISR